MSQMNDNHYYGAATGGGYMTTGSPYRGAGGSPGGFARKGEAAHSLCPMTIYQLIQAHQAHTDADWMLDDHEIGQVTVVAHIASLQVQATNSQYMLDDGSGRIEARHWTNSSVEDESEMKGIVEGAYVRVLGNLKTFGNKKYINTNLIRPIASPAEIYFHLLEAMNVTMIWERGLPPKLGQGPPEITSWQNGAGAYSAQAKDANNDDADLSELERSIITFIKSQPETPEGIHCSAIARVVGGSALGISNALDKLTEKGKVYTGADDSHFLAC